MRILWQGARGPAVSELQAKLKDLGFTPGKVNGIFGPSTTAAVIAFQQDRRLFADGMVGPQTLHALGIPTNEAKVSKPTKSTVFISYSHTDEKWLKMLKIHLAPLERNGNLKLWDDQRIAPGTRWREEIAAGIQAAKIAILLISANFLASEFIAENELPPLLNAAAKGGTAILPVIISPCVLGKLADYQTVNPLSKPLVDLGRGDRDRVWVKVVEAITAALND